MYKFNFLGKINQQKILEKKTSKFVALVFYSSMFASLLIFVLIFISTKGLGGEAKIFTQGIERYQAKSKALRSKKDYFRSRDFRKIYGYYSKKIAWTEIFSALFSQMDKDLIIDEMFYNSDVLNIRFKIKSQKDESIANILKEITDFKDSLLSSDVLQKYLQEDKNKNKILQVGNPSESRDEDSEEEHVWSFSFDFNLKEITKAENKNRSSSRRKRF